MNVIRKPLILFDIDYTLSCLDRLRELWQKYFASLTGLTERECSVLADESMKESYSAIGFFKPSYYARSLAEKLKKPEIEKEIISIFENFFPYEKAVYEDARQVLPQLADFFTLGIQSDGDREFQLKKIQLLRKYFTPNLLFVFKDKKQELLPLLQKKNLQPIVIDDKPDHVADLCRSNIRAVLVNRGPYATARKVNYNYPIVNDLFEFKKYLSFIF